MFKNKQPSVSVDDILQKLSEQYADSCSVGTQPPGPVTCYVPSEKPVGDEYKLYKYNNQISSRPSSNCELFIVKAKSYKQAYYLVGHNLPYNKREGVGIITRRILS